MQDFCSKIFCGSKNRDMQRFLVLAVRRNAIALSPEKDPPLTCSSTLRPGIAQAVSGRGMWDYRLLQLEEQAGNPRSDRLYQGSSRASCRKRHCFSISNLWRARLTFPLASTCGSTKNPKAAHLAVTHRADRPETTDRSRTKDSPACNR